MRYAFPMVRLTLLLLLSYSLTAAPRPHPRLQVDGKLLVRIRALRDAQDPAWLRMQKFTASAGTKAQPQAVVLSNMLVYLVSQDSEVGMQDIEYSIQVTDSEAPTDRYGRQLRIPDLECHQ